MIERLNRPRMDYRSHPPYLSTFEWEDGECWSVPVQELRTAVTAFWTAHPSLGDSGSADRRVVVDARGETILGTIDSETKDWVATEEVLDVLRHAGVGEQEVEEFEVNVRFINVWAEQR